jgi:hypothetical protein
MYCVNIQHSSRERQIIRLSHIPFTRRFVGDITLAVLSMYRTYLILYLLTIGYGLVPFLLG